MTDNPSPGLLSLTSGTELPHLFDMQAVDHVTHSSGNDPERLAHEALATGTSVSTVTNTVSKGPEVVTVTDGSQRASRGAWGLGRGRRSSMMMLSAGSLLTGHSQPQVSANGFLALLSSHYAKGSGVPKRGARKAANGPATAVWGSQQAHSLANYFSEVGPVAIPEACPDVCMLMPDPARLCFAHNLTACGSLKGSNV